jgi:predicted MPP superfamily phosphohydrolase
MDIKRRRFLKLAGATGGFALLGSYPIFIESYMVLVNRYRVAVPHLPKVFSGFTIVQLSDLHYGPLVPMTVIRRVVRQSNSLRKDIVVCTGDYVHEHHATDQIDKVWPTMAQLEAERGVFSVLGNHDHWADTDRSLYWLDRAGQNLRHRAVPIEKNGERIWLAGAGDLWEDHRSVDRLLQDVPRDACRIVLAHNPDTADTPSTERVDLLIAGHTHGGQVRIPFLGAPVLPVRNKAYSSGLKTSPRGTRVFISKGVGWSVYPIRFNCPPEIAVLELVPERREA